MTAHSSHVLQPQWMINASGCDAQFEQHQKLHLMDGTCCRCVSFMCISADAQFTTLMVPCTQTQMIHIDTRSLHCESDSLVMRMAAPLDRKHVVILGARCACSLPSCEYGWARTSVDDEQGVGHPTTAVRQHSRSTHTDQKLDKNPQTHATLKCF